jgi:endonuclease-3
MPRESRSGQRGQPEQRERATELVRRLFAAHPDAHCELDHDGPYQLLCATILSAQCTDKRVNTVTPELFRRWPDAHALSRAAIADIEDVIRSTGFYRNKAKSLSGMAGAVVEHHDGRIPDRLEELVKLPGVGRKTANVILGNAFGVAGLVVDTHVGRIARRLGLTREKDAVKIEHELMDLLGPEHWTPLSHAMIFHGRRVCAARKPDCEACTLRDLCPEGRERGGVND